MKIKHCLLLLLVAIISGGAVELRHALRGVRGSELWLATMAWTEPGQAHIGTFVAVAASQESASAQALADFSKRFPRGHLTSIRLEQVPLDLVEKVCHAPRRSPRT